MRIWAYAAIALLFTSVTNANESNGAIDKQISEALRDVHDRGADVYGEKDYAGCYRMYQGGIIVAKNLLGHRPKTLKIIADGMAEVERQETQAKKAYLLHELIEKVRDDLRIPVITGPEKLAIPPRELKPEEKPMAKVSEVSSGALGRVLWQGQPVSGVDVMYVSVGRLQPKVFEATTGAQGVYVIATLEPGKYIVTINAGPMSSIKKLPERYSTTTTSPLVLDVKGKGEKLDFLLQ